MDVSRPTAARRRRPPLLAASAASLLLMVGALPAVAQGSPPPGPALPSATPIAGFSIPHDVPDLESLFPDAVDGRPLFKMSMGRPTLEAMGDASLGDLDALVVELGVERGDLELAFANDPSASPPFNYFAFRVAGVPGPTLVETYERMVPRTEVDAVVQHIPVAERQVVWVSIPNNPIPNIWFWAQEDTLVGIQTADQPTFERLDGLLAGVPASPAPGATSDPGATPDPT